MVEIALGSDQGTQLELPSALNNNAEAKIVSPSASINHAEVRFNRLLDFLTKRSGGNNGCLSITKASKSTGSQNRYYRYTYREAGKQRVKSIPGGNIRSKLAQDRAKQVKEAILGGKSISEIVYMIGSFKKK